QKKPPARSSRLAAIVNMTATSFANTEDGRSIMPASSHEAIANPAHGTNKRRALRVVSELLPHATDEHTAGPVVRLRVDAAERFHDAVSTEHASPVSHQDGEELEFRGRERER